MTKHNDRVLMPTLADRLRARRVNEFNDRVMQLHREGRHQAAKELQAYGDRVRSTRTQRSTR